MRKKTIPPNPASDLIQLNEEGQRRFSELQAHPPFPTESMTALGSLGGFQIRSGDLPIGVSPEDFEEFLAIVTRIASSDTRSTREWLIQWMNRSVPALGGLTPIETLKKPEGKERVAQVLMCMGSGAFL